MMEAHWKRYQQLETENQALRDSLIHFCDEDRERLGQGVGAFSECPLCSILRLERGREIAWSLAASLEKLSEHTAVEHGCACGIIPVVMDNVVQFKASQMWSAK